jgi:hypothetical protein
MKLIQFAKDYFHFMYNEEKGAFSFEREIEFSIGGERGFD